jgi:hypothetical protein
MRSHGAAGPQAQLPQPVPRSHPARRCVFIFGRGVHTAADAAHSLVTEISPHLAAATPPPLLSCLRLLDEHVGHLILFSGYFAFWAVLLRGSRPDNATKIQLSFSSWDMRACIAAVVMGATHAVALIESSHPELCLLPLLLSIVAAFSQAPLLLRVFTIVFAATLLAAMAAYLCVLGSFKQPSEMGGVFSTARLAVSIISSSIHSAIRSQDL